MVALALLSSATVVTFAIGIANFVAPIFAGQQTWQELNGWLWLVLGAGLSRALLVWLQEIIGWRVASVAKSSLRNAVLDQVDLQPAGRLAEHGVAKLVHLITDGLNALDVYFSKFVPQLIQTAVVTPLLVLFLWWLDPTSGLVFLVTLPLIPIFMILIGRVTQVEQQRQQDSLLRLNGHFSEVLRGLSTLRLFGRINSQVTTLNKISRNLARKTLRVLRVTFLSGFALELAASLSVALIAVTIGMRLVSGEFDLLTALIVLILAPEVYLPLRMIGMQYHAATEGIAASNTVLNQLELWRSTPELTNAKRLIVDLAKSGELLVLTGESGVGKSTWMTEQALTKSNTTTHFAQSHRMFAGTVLENICGPGLSGQIDSDALRSALTHACLDEVELQAEVNTGGSGLSGGQRQRVLLARAFYRVFTTGSERLLLDEPTSSVDVKRLQNIVEQTHRLAQLGLAVTVITHQQPWISAADRHLEVSPVVKQNS